MFRQSIRGISTLLNPRSFKILGVPIPVLKDLGLGSAALKWRLKNLDDTLQRITDVNEFKELKSQAANNLNTWKKEKANFSNCVEVINQDWGKATLDATKKTGEIYAALNNGDSYKPGGDFLNGTTGGVSNGEISIGQEENMWQRSDCARSLLNHEEVYYDNDANEFFYHPSQKHLVDAFIKMTPEELQTLSQKRGETVTEAYKVFLEKDPRICFKGTEFAHSYNDNKLFSSEKSIDMASSFQLLPKTEIFPFYELRSSAPDISKKSPNLDDADCLKQYKQSLRRRIAAQLDTLIINDISNVVISGWGCGFFGNNTEIVANIYREEIQKRSHCFHHIVFSIKNNGINNQNYLTFNKILDGLKLDAQQKSSWSKYFRF